MFIWLLIWLLGAIDDELFWITKEHICNGGMLYAYYEDMIRGFEYTFDRVFYCGYGRDRGDGNAYNCRSGNKAYSDAEKSGGRLQTRFFLEVYRCV